MPPSNALSGLMRRPEDQEREAAAILIQRTWRGRKEGKEVKEELGLNEESRWDDALADTRLEVARKEAASPSEEDTPKRRWKRAVFLIGRLLDQHPMYSGRRSGKGKGKEMREMKEDEREYLKQLEGQHWLELIDQKHRYGSNLKYYHQRWKESDTRQNFFHWLDDGDGKEEDLKECPRERLESERIIYLSTEQRLNYLAKITNDGKLVWAKNNQPIDTTAGAWKDTDEGGGIVSQHLPTSPIKGTANPNTTWPSVKDGEVEIPARSKPPPPRRLKSMGSESSVSSREKEQQKNAATHYASEPGEEVRGSHGWSRYLWRHLTLRGLMEKLLRKTVERNTWMYISDKDFNIYIGIKETGYFQHSSFLSGGMVTSAGLIKVKGGQIRSISPLSGHYRTSIEHFHRFIEALKEQGVDLSRVSMTKAEVGLWGIERLGHAKKAQEHAVKEGKKKVKEAPKEVKHVVSHGDGREEQSQQGTNS